MEPCFIYGLRSYLLYSGIKDRYYIGHTKEVLGRIEEHNLCKNLGARDWVLKYREHFDTRSEAMKLRLGTKRDEVLLKRSLRKVRASRLMGRKVTGSPKVSGRYPVN